MILISCDPKETLPETPGNWEKADGFEEELYNGKVINEKLYVASQFRIFSNATIQGPNDFEELDLFISGILSYRLPLSDKLMVAINRAEVNLLPPGKSNLIDATVLNMRDIDPEFFEFHHINFSSGNQICIFPNGGVLVPYRSIKEQGQKLMPDFLWLKTTVENGRVKILEQKLIKEDFLEEFSLIRIIQTFDNFARVTFDGETFDIDHSGNMEFRFDSYSKSVQVGNEIYTFTSKRLYTFPILVYKSDLFGRNNQLVGTFESNQISSEDHRSLMQYSNNLFSINKNIVLNNSGKIFKLEMDNSGIILNELDNKGLEKAYITSIQVLENSKVFITSLCPDPYFPECGGFYKPLDKFFTPK